MARAKKVSFWATKVRKVPVRVNFRNRYGERVSFTATKRVPRSVKVRFWAGGNQRRKRYYR